MEFKNPDLKEEGHFFENSRLSETAKKEILEKIKRDREMRQNEYRLDSEEKKNLIEKILLDRRKIIPSNQNPIKHEEKKAVGSPENEKNFNLMQSPEENWDDIVNKEIINSTSVEQNQENLIYDNLSKMNKNFIFNSDSKIPVNQENTFNSSKKVKFEKESADLDTAKKRENKYFQKIKNKYGKTFQSNFSEIRRKSLEEYELQKQQYDFKPKINEYKGVKTEISKEERWSRLTTNKIEKMKQNELVKQEKEKKEIAKTCTFQPEINQDFEMKDEQKLNLFNLPVEERLHKEGMEMKLYREKLKREVYDKMIYTFKPEIEETLTHLKGEKASQKPIHERLTEVMRAKKEALHKLRFEAEEEKKMSFQPQINPKSAEMALKKFDEEERSKNVIERLIQDAHEKPYRKDKIVEQINKEQSLICTFNPSINPCSKSNDEILQNNSFYKYNKDFVTRQYLMADSMKEKMEKKALQIKNEESCFFAPKINKITQFIIEADPERADEKLKDKVERLAKKDFEKREMVQEQMAKAYYDKYNFKPEINEISKKIGRSNTIDKLASSKDNSDHKKALQEAALKAEENKCTFRPQIMEKRKFKNVQSNYRENVMENIQMEKKKKEAKIIEIKKLKEFDELKNCAFKPNINRSYQYSPKKNNIEVKGIDKFLEMKEKKKKMEIEKKQREEKIFALEKKYNPINHGSYTAPKPFALSRGNESKKKSMQKEIQENYENECTFQPKTNEANKRLMIKKILQENN